MDKKIKSDQIIGGPFVNSTLSSASIDSRRKCIRLSYHMYISNIHSTSKLFSAQPRLYRIFKPILGLFLIRYFFWFSSKMVLVFDKICFVLPWLPLYSVFPCKPYQFDSFIGYDTHRLLAKYISGTLPLCILKMRRHDIGNINIAWISITTPHRCDM